MKRKSHLTVLGAVGAVMGAAQGQAQGKDPSPCATASATPLATEEQIESEKLILRLYNDPAVKAEIAKAIKELRTHPIAASRDGSAGLEEAVRQWAAMLIYREAAGDTNHPRLIWLGDTTPHSWLGQTLPASSLAGVNPDNMYRQAFLDGDSRYEVLGCSSDKPPAQLSIELASETPSTFLISDQNEKRPDFGSQAGLITDLTIKREQDGSFRIAIDRNNESGAPNHLKTKPGPLALIVRDTLSDWKQVPNTLMIRRLDPSTAAAPLSEGEIRSRVIAHIGDFVRVWAKYPNNWLGGLKPNVLIPPASRDGGWGYIASARFDLSPDDAMVITTTLGGAVYSGAQVNDPWMITPYSGVRQNSLTNAQLTPNADGSFTYVISERDPGVANWLDTGGLRLGFLLFRWQGFAAPGKAEELVRGYRVVKLAELDKTEFAGLPRVTPVERRKLLQQREVEYRQRFLGAAAIPGQSTKPE